MGRAETAETRFNTYQKVTLKKMEKSSNKSPVTMEKPDDLTLEQCQEVENIEDFKRLCEINCKGDEEIKDMVELRRKIKNRDAAQRSRQKRIEGTKKLQFQNVDYSGLLRREEENVRAAEREREGVANELQELHNELERRRLRLEKFRMEEANLRKSVS